MAFNSNGWNSEDERDHDDRIHDGGNKPVYLMEHLATFTVTKDTGIVYPADGMRRLLQLEKSNGIWSQKMQLCLDRPWVLIMDYETGNVMERFPASLIQEPTAFTSHDPMEMYNNILVFIVGKAGTGHNNHPEMHIFQCQSISAQDLVEDLKELCLNKPLTRNRNSSIPPPPTKSPPQPPVTVRESFNARESDSELTAINDETSSTTSEKYERDVTVLNHCFDDIEKFIARLQHAAAATRELERRRRNRKNKKRDLGDGMLTMRTKPPLEREFVDIFQKFKLSFNLLAKLKAHIHDPNAPELVHFLFTPLALIVDASHETYYDPNLPAKVVSPLLTREAVNLLMNCVTSKETELWHSLGNCWLVPRDQWKGHVPPYHPTFLDGWSPDYPVIDESEATPTKRESHVSPHFSADYFDNREQKIETIPNVERDFHSTMRDMSARSDISIDSIERNGTDIRNFERSQENWVEELQERGASVVQVTYPRTANNDKELTVVRGEFLEVLDDSRKWWKARNSRGQVAHVPHTIVTPYHFNSNANASEPNEVFSNPLYTHNYNRSRQDSFSDRGQSPNNHDQGYSGPTVPAAPAEWIRKERLDNSSTSSNEPPSPPPLPPPINMTSSSAPLTFKRTPSLKSLPNYDPEDQMRTELAEVLTLYKNRKSNYDIVKTPEVFISQTSNPKEVLNWLRVKGFSDGVCQKFKGYTGHQLFGLSSVDFEKLCGSAEGKRLASQVTIQRNVSGYQTVRSSELKAILAKARKKAEE